MTTSPTTQPALWQPPASPNYAPPLSPTGNFAPPAMPHAAPQMAPQMMMPGSPFPAMPAQYFEYANFGKRFLALMIDTLIIGAMELGLIATVYALALGMGYLVGDVAGALVLGVCVWLVTPALALAVVTIYFVKGETGLDQGTIGKRVMGIKVVNLRGETISAGQSIGRMFSRFLSNLFFCLGYFMALFTEKKQALHDMIAGTVVLER